MTTEIATRTTQELEAPTRGPGRPLGLRAEPTLRLSIGFQNPERKGAPDKLDYFRAKVGTDQAHTAAAHKFHQVFGDQPKAIDIRLPGELRQALDIRHRAWGGHDEDQGGVLKAIGATNFATVGTLGGPDTLTVWNPDGTVAEVAIDGVDDPVAVELGVALETTFRFHIPKVLGAAGYAEITSKGQKTTDNLFARLVELYSMLGSRVSFAIEPKLVLRKTSARPVIPDRKTGELRRIKSTIYALDLYVPESIEEMLERLERRQAALYGGTTPAAALYGPQAEASPAEAPAGEAGAGTDAGADEATAVVADGSETGGSDEASASEPANDFDGDEPDFTAPEGAPAEAVEAAAAAAEHVVQFGQKHKGRTIEQISREHGDPKYVLWLADKMEPKTDLARAAQSAARVYADAFLRGES